MQKSGHLSQKISSLKISPKYFLRHMGSRGSQIATGQQASPTVFPEKRGKSKSSKQGNASIPYEESDKVKVPEHRIDIVDEKSNLLGYEIFSGKLVLDKRATSSDVQSGAETSKQDGVDARLSSKALVWGSHMLRLEDVISVSSSWKDEHQSMSEITYSFGMRHFTVNSYPTTKKSCLLKPQRVRKNFRFLAANPEEAIKWVTGFSDHHCFVNCLPHPMKQGTDDIFTDPFFEHYIKSKTPPKVLVILNPRSGHGRSSKVFHEKVEPIFKLAGFQMEVVKTTSAGHAKNLASTVDFSTCPDGIICVGGDGIVNEVLNGLLGRNDQKEAISIPIGVIPAGSDNSLVWTILGVRDPISAAITIVKGGLTATDVFAVEWIQKGNIHFGTTVTYFGFISDVLELSEKYQKRFGPLRYFVAGFLKFLCLPKYTFELEYLPASNEVSDSEGKVLGEDKLDMSDLYIDIMQRSKREGLPRANSLSSIDSIMTPSRMSGGDVDTGSTLASSEPSEYVRCLDPKSKRLSVGRNNVTDEPEEVIHPQPHHSATRTRSKSRTDKGWSGLTTSNDARCSWGATTLNDKEDISSTISDPGSYWTSGPKWDDEPDFEPTWDGGNPIHLPGPPDDLELGIKKDNVPKIEEKWVAKKGPFLGVLICNHSCKTVQSSQVVAPKAEHDDNSLDLLLVHGSGRLRLARFFMRLQCGRHLSLPYVEYVKVKAVKVRPGKVCHHGCGIDGELIPVSGQVICSVLPEQCRLIGHPAGDCM